MGLDTVDPKPISDSDASTVYTAITPVESIAGDVPEDDNPFGTTKPSPSSVPCAGSTFIIRSASSGKLITLLEGQVVLASPGSRGSVHWACVEIIGWIGFRSPVSGRYLGHDSHGKLCCTADKHSNWEKFCVRMRPEGGYNLLMTHFDGLFRMGIKVENGVEKLAKIGHDEIEGMVWEFVKD